MCFRWQGETFQWKSYAGEIVVKMKMLELKFLVRQLDCEATTTAGKAKP
ncbi:hypothetical protein D082_15910 [Synechocystis sp. PCC 6714]|nr:hypothetical protein D082_15910 [Synechocystis sp. PCC 6714]